MRAPAAPFHHANLAYLLYTSGSTGLPKGVMVEHRNVLRLVKNTHYIDFKVRDRVLQTGALAFDASTFEIWGALLNGLTLYLEAKENILNPMKLKNMITANHIVIMWLTSKLFNQMVQMDVNIFAGLRYLLVGGEVLSPSHIEQVRSEFPNLRIINGYGPTENTTFSTTFVIEKEYKEKIPIGKPIANSSAYIVDSAGKLQPIGVIGEIRVGGAGVARGYLNNPELTAEKFIDFHHSVLYRTGDLGRWLGDGNIEFIGRSDHQVKLRGYRIELGEIENRLLTYEAIKEAVVIDRIASDGSLYLCAYFVPGTSFADKPGSREIREFLSRQLPDYMIPSYFIEIEKIPLNANGKLERRALPAPEMINLREEDEYIPPVSAIEKILVEIWEKVLGRQHIGIDENFFMIGGDSIKAIQVISRMNSAGYQVEMKAIFQYPVIAALAPQVKKLKRFPEQAVITGTIPLTPIQAMFFEQSYSHPHHFNQSVMFYVRERIEKDILKNIFVKIQEHHDALRMTYHINKENGKVTQIDHGLDYPFSLEEYEIIEPTVEKIQSSIDLEKGPLMKLGLFHLEDGDRLLIAIHHLVIDGVSWRILFEDIETLYRQAKQGEKLVLPPKTDSFKLWAEKLSSYADSKTILKEKAYWQKVDSSAAPLIPKDFETIANDVKDTASISFTLSEKETRQLHTKVNEAFGTEINDILLTALAKSIKKTFGNNRVSIALEGHGREDILEDIDVSRTVGWFTSLYPVCLDVSQTGDLGRQLKEIKETLRQVPNKGIGYGILKYLTVAENKKELEFKLKPQISFNYLGQFDAEIKQISSFEIAKESAGNAHSLNNQREYLLDVSGITTNNRLGMTISFNQTHFKGETIKALVANLETGLKHIIEFCCAQEKIERTPGDFTYKGLSIESVNRLMEAFPNAEDLYTLTPMQEGMLFHALVDNTSYAYFEQISYQLLGELDIYLVEKSVNELFKRHDILRTAFVYKDIERPVQVVLPGRVSAFYYEDISKTGVLKEKEDVIKEFKEKDKQRSFDLSNGLLIRAAVLRTAEAEYEFIWSFHHIVMDGWCIGILNTEFFEIYTSYLENRPYRLPGVKPYRSYIQWFEKQDKNDSARYWANYLDSYDEQTGIPKTKIVKKGETGYRNETVSAVLTVEKTAALNRLAAGNHVTLNTVINTLWGILLGKYNDKGDVLFGAVVSGRPFELEGVETMVGLFINTIPVRIRFAEGMKLNALFRKTQEEALESEPYHHHSLVEIQAGTTLKQNLIDHIVIFENYPIAEKIAGYGNEENKKKRFDLKIKNVDVFEQSNYDFNMMLAGSRELRIVFQYNGTVYDRDDVERISAHFLLAIDRAIENEELKIREIVLLTDEEKNRLLYDFNNTAIDYPKNKTIHQLFAEQVEKAPDHISLAQICRPIAMSYNELNERSNQLAGLLIEKGARADQIIGIKMERSIEMITGLLGILKSGGAYLPIDPEYPRERIKYMLKDSGARILINKSEIRNPKFETNPNDQKINDPNKNRHFGTSFVLNLHHLNFEFVSNFDIRASNFDSSNLAYIMYTSGSTGKPKGVMVDHHSVIRLVI
ncbi:MAG TPA: amino acid adenylation domain-containing protein, partial [Candidatus Kapabacteria bacterium]|nr:amino acid adenylation domain-containing protein [Candidatus Kapabacteria bacterium]